MEPNPTNHVSLFFELLLLIAQINDVFGHGGLIEPPMRSVAWKYGFDAPVNYDWMGLYCGGLGVFQENGGKCGLCGDPYNGPFDNDRGGVYDTGIIVRHYPAGLGEIEVKVELTAHHKGHFQFKLCPNNENPLSQSCLDRYPLMIRESRTSGDPYKYYPPKEPKLNELHVLLPVGVMCDRCVLQWTYTAGNSVGQTASGESCLGCGIQETFVNCADISIGGNLDRIPVENAPPTDDSVVVIEQRPDLREIIQHASPDSVTDILQALNRTDRRTSFGNHPFSDRNDDRRNGNSGFSNRDPSMFVPPLPPSDMGSERPSSHADAPGFTRDSFRPHDILPPHELHGLAALRASEALRNQRRWFQGPHPHSFHPGHGPPFLLPTSPLPVNFIPHHEKRFDMRFHVPPPSQLSSPLFSFRPSSNHDLGESHRPSNSLPTSAPKVAGDRRNVNINIPTGHSEPSREFVEQMTELRRKFPNTNEWRRGDGISSSNDAVRKAPQLDTHEFSASEIRSQVPSLPRDLGPRHDFRHEADPRIHPSMAPQRQNWFPTTQFMQRSGIPAPVDANSRLPRRIVVHTMAIAQHLLRKYPQLKGRVYLSRDAHLRDQFSHMMHKYAIRQNGHSQLPR